MQIYSLLLKCTPTFVYANVLRGEWAERKAVIKYGNKLINKFNVISDIDTSALQKALQKADYKLAYVEAQKVKALGKELYSLEYLENPFATAKLYSLQEAKAVNEAVKTKIESWAGLTLEEQKKKLTLKLNELENTRNMPLGK